MAATRELIERTLRELNDAENSPALSPAEKVAAIDRLCTPDAHGWSNGQDRGDRTAEREVEDVLFSTFPDYCRVFEQVVIDPPRAAWTWRMTGSSADSAMKLDLSGASVAHFDDEGKIHEVWLYYHDPFESDGTGDA